LLLKPYVDSFQPDGTAMFQFTNELSFVVHSQPGTATSNIVLNLTIRPTTSGRLKITIITVVHSRITLR
jgi:hypothetical protein